MPEKIMAKTIGIVLAIATGVALYFLAKQQQIVKLELNCQYCGIGLIVECRRRPGYMWPITSYFVCPACGETNLISGQWKVINVRLK